MSEQKTTANNYQRRRMALVESVKRDHPAARGMICLFAAYEQPRHRFWQESSFFYFTGIREPGAVLTIDLDGASTLYVPAATIDRAIWVSPELIIKPEEASLYGLEAIKELGKPIAGYAPCALFSQESHAFMIEQVQKIIKEEGKLFVASAPQANFLHQRFCLERWCCWMPNLKDALVDISGNVAALRRRKEPGEVALIQHAINITIEAHEYAVSCIADGMSESFIDASIKFSIHTRGAECSFPPIVGSGPRGAILHYDLNNQIMRAGELVVIDCGASWEGYAGDLSRTYPVSGKFTPRQKELYDYVVAVQGHIESIARPGMWLNNKEHPEKSLQHQAIEFFKRYKVDQYFVHGIGHFLGLDVHDVGDLMLPLAEGDVITIEPGLYIPQEGIGIRVEDNFLITATGVKRLSASLPYRMDL